MLTFFLKRIAYVCDCTFLSLGRCVAENLYFDKTYSVDLMSHIRAPKLVASVGVGTSNGWLHWQPIAETTYTKKQLGIKNIQGRKGNRFH